jgi:uncharacterized RDD family membrane protein YckC
MSDPNPYAPPKAPVADLDNIETGPDVLASRGQRAGAATLDSLFAIAWGVPLWIHFKVFDYLLQGESIPWSVTLLIAALGFLLFMLVNGYFLNKNGQTLGKKLVGIRIVTLDGSVPEFWRIIGLRYAPISVAALLPFIGFFADTLDALFIYRSDRRCLHDLIAGTKVVRVVRTPRN